MNYIKILVLFSCLPLLICSCQSYHVDIRLLSGEINGSPSGNTYINLDNHDQTLLFIADVSLETGKLSIDVITPSGEVFKSVTVTANGKFKTKESLPSILGKWELTTRGDTVKGIANVGFRIPRCKKTTSM